MFSDVKNPRHGNRCEANDREGQGAAEEHNGSGIVFRAGSIKEKERGEGKDDPESSDGTERNRGDQNPGARRFLG